ncbi:YhgE/Pip domain-containing protein [Gleimia hominis]|uniref:YhgE/Pip domain-containing protein n=1 Tax=Gleimia hominis TaxID=595468 RepID=UPI000C7FB27B|nr:YhgE/Pip domain-containing protein [Gleimia hominis]WIK65035.1 YhgE/Pip domain-containing protein [Gleimia hominis]
MRRMRPRDWRALVAVLLLPILASALTLWAVGTRTDNFDQVQAAIVNLDKGAKMQVDGEEKTVPLGRQLTAGLMYPQKEVQGNLDWNLVPEKDAEQGLKDGTYSAVITIPKDFSKNIATIGTADATPGLITVTSNDASSPIMGIIGKQISETAAKTFGEALTKNVLDEVYLGFNQMHDQLNTAAEGADKLNDGSHKLAGGIHGLDQGSKKLAGGAGQLQGGIGLLSDGIGQSADGAYQLASGVNQLTGGLGQLTGGAKSLSDGVAQARNGFVGANGSAGLLPGIEQLNAGVNGKGGLADGSKQLADGTAKLSVNIGQFVDTANGVIEPILGFEQEIGNIDPAEIQAIIDQIRDELGNLEGLEAQLQQWREQIELLADIVPAADHVVAVANQCPVAQAGEYCESLQDSAKRLDASVQPLRNLGQQLSPGQRAASGDGVNASARSLQGALDQLKQLVAKLHDLASQMHNSGGLQGIHKQLNELKSGTEQLADGAQQLSDGVNGTQSKPGLAQGLAQLSQGAQQFKVAFDGTRSQPGLVAGSRQLYEGLAQAQAQVPQFQWGVDQLAAGLGEMNARTPELQNGALQLAGGINQLSDGTSKLSAGADQLTEGTNQFASQLKDGVKQVPTYTDAERTRIVDMASIPARAQAHTWNEASATYNAIFPWAAAFVLWIGALGTFLVMPGLRRRELSSAHSSMNVVWRSSVPAVVSAVVQALGVFGVAYAVGVRPANSFTTLLVLLVAAIAFALINQMLLAVFGSRIGRVLALLLLVVQVVALGGILPIETAPPAFQSLNAVMPLSIATSGLTHTAIGGQLTSLFATLMPLVLWGAASFVLSFVAVPAARQRAAKAA